MWPVFGPALTSQWRKLLKFHLRLRNGFETQMDKPKVNSFTPNRQFWEFSKAWSSTGNGEQSYLNDNLSTE